MKKINLQLTRKYLTIVALLFASVQSLQSQNSDSKGKDFWLMFNRNYSTPELKLFITSTVNTSGTVSMTGFSTINFTVTANTITTVVLNNSLASHTNDAVGSKGIHVVANDEVTVYGLNKSSATTDAFLGLPSDVLGTEYRIMSFKNVAGTYNGTQFGVVATENGTTITITPSVTTMGHTAGVSYTKTLNAGQTYELRNESLNSDLTGTLISADKPVGVVAGNACANIPFSNTGYCDHICEMLPPIASWGAKFITVPLKSRIGDTYKFLAAQDSTVIKINGTAEPMIHKGQSIQKIYTGAAFVESNKPILAVQFSNGTTYDNAQYADPFMLNIPPLEQFLGAYTTGTVNGFARHYVNLVVPNSIVSTIIMDGSVVGSGNFTAIGTTGFSYAQLTVTDASHSFSGTLPFGVFSYGFNFADSYGYAGGQSFSEVATVTDLVLTPVRDTANVNTSMCLEATVTDQNGDPVVDIKVDFGIQGPNSSQAGFAFTDSNGVASFCYAGVNGGSDTITASIGALSDNSIFNWITCTTPAFTTCPANIETGTSLTTCDKAVSYTVATSGTPAPAVSYTYSGATTGSGTGDGSGSVFNTGTTTVTLSATNTCGTVSCSFDVVVVDDIDPVVVTENITRTLSNGTVTITAEDIDNGSTDNCDVESISVSPSTFDCSDIGENTVTLTVTDVNGNEATATATVTIVGTIPTVSIAPTTAEFCKGSFVTITATGSESGTYLWGNAATTASIDASQAGTYSVTFTNGNGCTATASQTVIENANPLANAGADVNIYYGYTPWASDTLVGSASSGTSPYTYSWNTGSSSSSIIVSPTSTTTYTLTVTDAKGCKGTDMVTANVQDVRCGKKMDKVLMCHNTNSKTNPTQEICVDENAVASHLNNHGDKVGSCSFSWGDPLELGENATVTVSPNPVTSSSSVSFYIPTDDDITVKLYSSSGTLLSTIYNGSARSGNLYNYSLDYSLFSYTGTYYIKLVSSTESVTVSVLKN